MRLLAAPLVVLLLLAGFVAGCGTASESAPRQQSRLATLALLYGFYIRDHRGPPKDEASFRKYVKETAAPYIKSRGLGFDDPELLFISERDGKPYIVKYGPITGPPGPANAPVIAYEQIGSGGMRWVASSLSAVEDADEAKFKKYVPNP